MYFWLGGFAVKTPNSYVSQAKLFKQIELERRSGTGTALLQSALHLTSYEILFASKEYVSVLFT